MHEWRRKSAVFILLLAYVFAFTGCSTELDKGDVIVMPSINPEIQTTSIEKKTNVTNDSVQGINNTNQTLSEYNQQSYYIQPQSKSILSNPLEGKLLDFDVIDGLLYLMVKSGESGNSIEYGNKIAVYDVDGQQLLNSLTKDDAMYVSMSQHDNKVFAYDYKSGEIHKFSADLKYEEKYPLLKGLACSKMAFSKEGWLLMLVFENNRQHLYVFDNNLKLKNKINPMQLATSIFITPGRVSQKLTDIRDIDFYDNRRVILNMIPRRLCLFNFKDAVIEKVGYMDNDEGVIAYDSNILYSAVPSVLNVNGISSTANLLERVFINDSYNWDVEDENNDKWTIPPIELPSNGMNTAHQKIKCRGSFIFMLDYPVNGGNLKDSEIITVNK